MLGFPMNQLVNSSAYSLLEVLEFWDFKLRHSLESRNPVIIKASELRLSDLNQGQASHECWDWDFYEAIIFDLEHRL